MVRQTIIEPPVTHTRILNRSLLTLGLLFFLSGISGLIYQLLWLRKLSLVFGVTVYAASTVLASFMAGLALGSFAAGRLADRARNPLFLYGLIEVLVGVSAVATPVTLKWIESFYNSLYASTPQSLALITIVRFVASFIVLLVPTTLMGATLPIIVKSSLLRAEGLGERVSFLYATNTVGAIVGTLVAGFYLIGKVGATASFQLAAALNVVVGIAAMVLSVAFRRHEIQRASRSNAESVPVPAASASQKSPGMEDVVIDVPVTEKTRKLVLLIFAASGFISLALEVIWFRVLILYLQVTTYAFTMMLATFLCGIAAGSYLVTPLMRRRINWLAMLAYTELAIGIVPLLSLGVLAGLYNGVVSAEALAGHPFLREAALIITVSLVAIFPTTILMGIGFPIGLRLWVAGNGDASTNTGERIGVFYSLNVFGAIIGSIVAGFLLLAWLGSRVSLIAVAAISLISGLFLLQAAPRERRNAMLRVGIAGVIVFVGAAFIVPDPLSLMLTGRYPGEQLLWREEGVQTTVSIHQQADGARVMYMDGLHQANDSAAMIAIHSQIAHLPLLIHHDPKDALVIGLGGGITAGEISKYPGINLDVVELSDTVLKGSDWFRHVNHDVVHQPNVHLRVDDGRNYLLLTRKRYDIITADIIQPVHAGAGSLYSAEYFALARNALNEDGLMLQWIGLRSDTQYKLMLRTFLSVFPEATLWADGSLVVGTKHPLQLDPADFARKLQQPGIQQILLASGTPDFQALLSLYRAGPRALHEFAGSGAILTDDKPSIEYFLSLPREHGQVDLSSLRD